MNPLSGGLIGFIASLINQLIDSLFGGLATGSGSSSLFPNLGALIGDLFGTKQTVNDVADVQIPRLDNRIDDVSSGGVSAKRSFFGNDGTWVRPEGGPWSRHVVDVIGGASGGGRANVSNDGGASGAGSGGYAGGWNSAEFFDSDLPASVNVEIGPGGAGSTVNGALGSAGGQTNFGNIISGGGATGAAHGFGAKTIPLRGGTGGSAWQLGLQLVQVPATAGTGHAYGNGGIAGSPPQSGVPGGNGNAPSPSTIAYPGTAGGGGAREGTVGQPGGNGGNGGYPGAPGGGGGESGPGGNNNGFGGNAAAGACWVTSYK